MARQSAGVIMYRRRRDTCEILLVHPGGPYWSRKDLGAWSIPKGEYETDEDPLEAAKREFREETGFTAEGDFIQLHQRRQSGGKLVSAWALEGDCDASKTISNTFTMEWPPHSGQQREFPEVDRAQWFPLDVAKEKILRGQTGFLEELDKILHGE